MYIFCMLCLPCVLLSQGQASPLSVMGQTKGPLAPFAPESALALGEDGGIFANVEIDTTEHPQTKSQDIQNPSQGNLVYEQVPLQSQNKASFDGICVYCPPSARDN